MLESKKMLIAVVYMLNAKNWCSSCENNYPAQKLKLIASIRIFRRVLHKAEIEDKSTKNPSFKANLIRDATC